MPPVVRSGVGEERPAGSTDTPSWRCCAVAGAPQQGGGQGRRTGCQVRPASRVVQMTRPPSATTRPTVGLSNPRKSTPPRSCATGRHVAPPSWLTTTPRPPSAATPAAASTVAGSPTISPAALLGTLPRAVNDAPASLDVAANRAFVPRRAHRTLTLPSAPAPIATLSTSPRALGHGSANCCHVAPSSVDRYSVERALSLPPAGFCSASR